MRIDNKRELAISTKALWDYMLDYRQWPLWFADMIEIVEPETGSFEKPGDIVRTAHKVLGRRLEYVCEVKELKEHELAHFVAETRGLPAVHHYWRFLPRDEDATTLDVTFETEPTENFFGTVIDRALMPSVYTRFLARSLENLEALTKAGLPA